MARLQSKSMTGKIFDNILFLEEVFGDQAEQDIPKLKKLGIREIFLPGTPTSAAVDAIRSAVSR